jgi:hypothetical protein
VATSKKVAESISDVDEIKGEIEIKGKDGITRYKLMPLEQLYAPDNSTMSINWEDDYYLPLLYCIESEIVDYYNKDATLTDGLVALTLDRMCANPAIAPKGDVLLQRLQMALQLELSLEDYTKFEVKQALRKILKSVERHSAVSGVTGYLDFIRKHIGH